MIYIFKSKGKSKSNAIFLKCDWRSLKARAQNRWRCIDDDDWEQLSDPRNYLLQKLQEKCGFTRERARDEIQRLEVESLLYEQPTPSCKRLEMEYLLYGKSTPPSERRQTAE